MQDIGASSSKWALYEHLTSQPWARPPTQQAGNFLIKPRLSLKNFHYSRKKKYYSWICTTVTKHIAMLYVPANLLCCSFLYYATNSKQQQELLVIALPYDVPPCSYPCPLQLVVYKQENNYLTRIFNIQLIELLKTLGPLMCYFLMSSWACSLLGRMHMQHQHQGQKVL